jgi:hypothetical protein
MEKRQPYNLTAIIKAYNIFQIVACSLIVYKYHQYGFSFRNTWTCIDRNPESQSEIDNLNWYVISLRIFELIETAFFVLRKKQSQVSLLHVYHHISTAGLMWLYLKYHNEGNMMEAFIVVANSSVHIIMYSYYLLSSIDSCRRFTNKFKHLITFVQITQLCTMLGQSIVALQPSCKTNHTLFYLQVINLTVLIVLFAQFYAKSFLKAKVK